MSRLQQDPPSGIRGVKVVRVRDYLPGEEIEGRVEDVLRFEFSEDGRDRVTVRPSGTEPKIKLYIQTYQAVESDLSATKKQVAQKVADLSAAVGNLVRSLAV